MIWLLAIITFIFLTIGLYFYYAYYIRPVRISKWYRNTLEAMGYKVLSYPYHPFKIMLVQNQKYHEKQNGDAFYDQKHTWYNYDVIISNTSNQITLVLINPRLIKHFFSPEKLNLFPKSHLNKQGFKLVLGNTMILNEGNIWKRKRIIFSNIFNFDFVTRNIPKMKNIVEEVLRQTEQQANFIQHNQTKQVYKLELSCVFENIISNIMIKCFFGAEGLNHKIDELPINKYLSLILKDARDQSTDPIVLLLGEAAYNWSLKSKYKNLKHRITKLKEKVRCIISQKLQKLKQQNTDKYTDIIQALWAIKKSNASEIYSMQQNQIIEQFCAFLTAGNDSTSFFMNMIMFYIVQNPEVQAKLRQQIHKHIRNINEITFQNLKKIDYLQWIQLQTNRMYGPATNILLREAAQDTYIDNIPILKGTGLKIQLLGNHYNEKYFTEPFKFKPQRWSNLAEINPYTFGGFSYGQRSCVGKQLAYLSTKIITVFLLLRYSSVQIDTNQKIVFQVRSFYTPSPFISTITKLKES